MLNRSWTFLILSIRSNRSSTTLSSSSWQEKRQERTIWDWRGILFNVSVRALLAMSFQKANGESPCDMITTWHEEDKFNSSFIHEREYRTYFVNGVKKKMEIFSKDNWITNPLNEYNRSSLLIFLFYSQFVRFQTHTHIHFLIFFNNGYSKAIVFIVCKMFLKLPMTDSSFDWSFRQSKVNISPPMHIYHD